MLAIASAPVNDLRAIPKRLNVLGISRFEPLEMGR
jgi:hypothetical protein